ncbi:MAG TPA: Asp-tRNA(Asn)/Glu-tRNA(Gln) amidotransferase subunit GatA [bacterium]
MPAAPASRTPGPADLTLHELRDRLRAGTCSPSEALEDLLARIERRNPALNVYLGCEPERLRGELDRQWRDHPGGRLRGVPITVKSNICVAGEPVSCASRILEGFRPPYDATVIERLRAEGAVIVPRANMDEFAFGSSTENSAFGAARNPRSPALDRVPGGSSGGSAAAVAADVAIAALGSDTGGSIRQPAAFCGVVGLKPTYGRVSRYGLVAFASSLDQIGPLTKDARDAAVLLSVIAGHDERDSTSAPTAVPDYERELDGDIAGMRIGIPALPEAEGGLHADVRTAVDEAVGVLRGLGMKTEAVGLPRLDKSVATYYVVATAEASSNLARYDGVQFGLRRAGPSVLEMSVNTRTEGFGAEAKRRILLGTYVLSQGYYDAYYLQAMKVRTLIRRDFEDAFRRCDVIVMPTAPTPAFRFGEKLHDPLQMYLSDVFTIAANLAGVPALSVCCGTSRAEGLPIGLQLIGRPFEEGRLLRVARAFEDATDWPARRRAFAQAETPR